MDGQMALPRDEFTVRLRELRDNPGAVSTSSRVDLPDFYGNAVTWTVDTFRVEGVETVFIQRIDAEGGLRLLVPPQVMSALVRGHDTLTGKMRVRGARQAVTTRKLRGDKLGNPEALKLARRTARKPRRKRGKG